MHATVTKLSVRVLKALLPLAVIADGAQPRRAPAVDSEPESMPKSESRAGQGSGGIMITVTGPC